MEFFETLFEKGGKSGQANILEGMRLDRPNIFIEY